MKKLEVKFNDSNFLHGWESEGVEDDLALASVVGYYKSEDNEQLTLTMAFSNFGLRFGKLTIPKGSIKSIKELRIK